MEKLGSSNNPNKKKRRGLINTRCFDGIYVTVDQDIVNQMNIYFCEIGAKLQDAIPNLG